MKKIIAISLALIMFLGLCACGAKSDETPSTTAAPVNGQSEEVGEESTQPAEIIAGEAKLTGKLNYITLDDRDSSVLRGVHVYGNRAGSSEFNLKDPATEGLRCIYELNEYVGVDLDIEKSDDVKVWILRHRDDQKFYETADFSDETPGYVQCCEVLDYADTPESNLWGEFYLNPDDCEAGYYDFVFVYEGKAIATLLTRFYEQGALENKTDAELTELMFG